MLDTEDSTNDATDGSTGTSRPESGRKRAVPPKRTRVSALATRLGVTSRAILDRLAELGDPARTASSSVDQATVDRLTELFADVAGSVNPVESDAEADGTPAAVLFVAPTPDKPEKATSRRRRRAPATPQPALDDVATDDAATTTADAASAAPDAGEAADESVDPDDVKQAAEAEASSASRRRRRRGRRGRGGGQRSGEAADAASSETPSSETGTEAEPDAATAEHSPDSTPSGSDRSDQSADADEAADDDADSANAETTDDTSNETGGSSNTRRRRRRRRSGGSDAVEAPAGGADDPPNTVTHVREPKAKNAKGSSDDGVKGVKGSTRLEARRQRRRDGRDTNRRRPPILTEAEFLARREAVDRVMAVRQNGDRTQIAVLEDKVLVEHYVTRASATSYVGNIYLGRVQNVLPSMEAAFIDIGKGRNGVLYAGEVNWDAAGLEGKSRQIEQALKSGDSVLVQVTKDPIGHKGARLTSQISLPGRFLVYVPGGGMTGISRRLPDNERHRLKTILKKIVPEDAGVIVRTAAEGASEEDLTRDVERLQAEWESIAKKAERTSSAPTLVHGEPDLATRVVRDVFNEDFRELVVQGDEVWNTVSEYVEGVAPDLAKRMSRHTGDGDLFGELRVDEQIRKALDRKVWLPSGGSLVIDRTEAMTVIDVNTGKFVGSGGNLEQTVTRNNLEAAEEIVRQLRLRDVGGIVVIDFIDMVLESNRELVLRRLTECLGRDRTKHQVAEVTSLGLVQMTRKRVGEGLLEAFSETCEVCHGRGVIISAEPIDKGPAAAADEPVDTKSKPAKRRRGKKTEQVEAPPAVSTEQRTKALAAMNAIHNATNTGASDTDVAELELDAVAAVLAGSELDADALAATVIESSAEASAESPAAPSVESSVESGVESAAEPSTQKSPTAEAVAAVVAGPETEPAAPETGAPSRPARPRRRRSASRPAGPPAAN